jgi:5-methylcytosine-specific restriction endonuclease McrA
VNKAKREEVYQKYDGHCAYCGRKVDYEDMQVDHFTPRNIGGTNDMDNLMPACRRCNHYKRANSLEGWRKMIEEVPKKLERDCYIYRTALDYGLVVPKRRKVRFYFEEVDK